jgi:hypothetical protein
MLVLSALLGRRVWGRGGADRFDLSGLPVPSFIQGGSGDDALTGGAAVDLAAGLGWPPMWSRRKSGTKKSVPSLKLAANGNLAARVLHRQPLQPDPLRLAHDSHSGPTIIRGLADGTWQRDMRGALDVLGR